VLLLVRVRELPVPLPRARSGDLVATPVLRRALAGRADRELRHQPGRPRLLPAHAEHVHAIVELEVEPEVVEDVPVLGTGPRLPSADAEHAHRYAVAERPASDVDVVHVLL